MVKIGIIGGSGLDDPKILENATTKDVETPYGKPSSALILGKIKEKNVVLIARHGRKHQFSPTQVNYRANIHALKQEKVTHILATTAAGSLREDIGRGDFIILDQFIDFTKHRKTTFHESFEKGMNHPSMPDPFDNKLRNILIQTSRDLGYRVHDKGTVVTIEGPRFSTRAESRMFKAWGADVVNMSIAPEAALANEAKIPYAVIAISTDYDSLFDHIEPVSWNEILKVFAQNVEKVKKVLVNSISKIE